MRTSIAIPVVAGLIGLAGLAVPVAAQASSGPTDTTLTLTVGTGGALTLTTPTSADLGTAPVTTTTISGRLGVVTVADNTAPNDGSWSVSVVSTDFTTGTGTPVETIPAVDVTYTPGATTAVVGTVVPAPGASDSPLDTVQTAYTATGEFGNSRVSWDPTIDVAVPATMPAGVYHATITHSLTGT